MSFRVCTEISGLLVLVCLSLLNLLNILVGFEFSCFSGSESDVGLWPGRARETFSWVLFPWAKFLCKVLVRDLPNLLQHSKMYKFHVFIASAKHMWWRPQWFQSTNRTTDVQQTPLHQFAHHGSGIMELVAAAHEQGVQAAGGNGVSGSTICNTFPRRFARIR